MYIYPDNLKSKAVLWLWELRDIAVIGVGALISVSDRLSCTGAVFWICIADH